MIGAILSFCKGVVLLDVVGSVQLFELIAVLLLEVWVVVLYEIRGVLKHVMEEHVLICVMGAVHL